MRVVFLRLVKGSIFEEQPIEKIPCYVYPLSVVREDRLESLSGDDARFYQTSSLPMPASKRLESDSDSSQGLMDVEWFVLLHTIISQMRTEQIKVEVIDSNTRTGCLLTFARSRGPEVGGAPSDESRKFLCRGR